MDRQDSAPSNTSLRAGGVLFSFVLGLCAAGALAVVFALAFPPRPGLQDLLELCPAGLAATLMLTLVAAVQRRPPAYFLVLTALVVTFALPMAPDMIRLAQTSAQRPPTDLARPIRVLTVNLWSRNTRFERLMDVVQAEDPDIIVVQEANHAWSYVLRSLSPKYEFVSGCSAPSQCNVAILSKFTPAPGASTWTSTVASADLILPARWGGGLTRVIAVHARHDFAEKQEDFLTVAALAGAAGRVIVAGDFNATPLTGRLAPLDRLPHLRRGVGLPTWPTPSRAFTKLGLSSPLALVSIDHIYAGDAYSTFETERLADIGSDHYPILATMALREAPTQPLADAQAK